MENSYSTPHHTIVPEYQARYKSGKEALATFLKENTKNVTANLDAKKLQAAKLFFTVTKSGTIENVKLDRPSGYPEVDEAMVDLINKAPGIWIPAINYKGEKVDQELVVSFGLMGC
ncbi:energy transducer TonB [Changchengzhania lutea]|uniref:energy transducer TonB n=1 Tax=Changchengzhania lutea TaxID=2049305 RepID=UPI00163DB13A|nr:TonB family protein [Changchengzhania lutea]